jgi:agmatine deiminase
MKINTLLFILSFIVINLQAQEEILPNYPTSKELKDIKDYINKKSASRLISSPPPAPVRTMAEWEQIQALIITWAGHNTILREIVRNAVKECKVLIITTDSVNVTNQLTNAGIPLDSVRFVHTPFNSIWVRDYGPWSVYKNDVDSLYLIDWIYNRPREQDDATPVAIAGYLGIPIYEAVDDPDDLVHTGGNHLPDGMGTAFSSMLVLEENNDKTESEIDSIVKKYLGVKQYIKFPTLPYDGIHHLDMHMRVIDEETIIFGGYPDGVADGPQINANIEYLREEFQTAFGNQYRVVRIPMPPEGTRYPDEGGDYRTYTNSIFINKTILVPTYEEKYDTTALRIYRENLPGYNVVGINCNSIIPSLGALHCITKLVGTSDPLLIAHPRLRDSDDADKEYPVTAVIKHRSGIERADLFYRTAKDSTYSRVSMSLVDSFSNMWTAIIPSHPAGTEIQYYIHAYAHSGKEQVRPIVAPEGYFNFRIYGEPSNQLPHVTITNPADGEIFDINDQNINIEITADDIDGEIVDVVVFIDGDSVVTINSLPYSYMWNFTEEGEYEITVRARDDKGAETLSVPVNVNIQNLTSEVSVHEMPFEIFPNPVSDIMWIKAEQETIRKITITNLFGQRVDLPAVDNGFVIGYDFSGVSAGLYFVAFNSEGLSSTVRVIKL